MKIENNKQPVEKEQEVKGEEKKYTFDQVKLIATRFARQSRLMNDVTSNDTIMSFDNWFNPENF